MDHIYRPKKDESIDRWVQHFKAIESKTKYLGRSLMNESEEKDIRKRVR